MAMKPPPTDWPRMTSGLVCKDAAAAIDWLCRAFGFQVRLKVENDDGVIIHSELEFGGGVVMIQQEGKPGPNQVWRHLFKSPASVDGANTQYIMIYVDDADAHCAHARSHGATIVDEPATHDYGEDYWADRSYGARDPEGHIWWVSQRISPARST